MIAGNNCSHEFDMNKNDSRDHAVNENLRQVTSENIDEMLSSSYLKNQSEIDAVINPNKISTEEGLKSDNYVNFVILQKSTKDKAALECLAKPGSHALCSKCGKVFSSNYNLKRHMTSCKLCPDQEKSSRYECDCGRSYTQEWDLKKHKSSCQDNAKKCKKCPFCHLLFYHRLQLQSHMKSAHKIDVQDPEIINFDSIEEFRLWKERIEEDTFTYYSKQTGSNVTGISVNTYYVCQHDGSDRIHSSLPRKTQRRNKKGRVKTGRFCWSQMNVKEFRDGSVRVTYHPSHTHNVSITDTKHHPLPPSITNEIDRRLFEVKKEDQCNTNDDEIEIKRSRKKSYAVNVRTLRSLARKNRKLFRITAEAINESDEVPSAIEEEEIVSDLGQLQPEGGVKTAVTSLTTPEQEHLSANMTQSCSWYCQQLKIYCETGRLSTSALSEMQSKLASLVDLCRQDIITSTSEWKGELTNAVPPSSLREPKLEQEIEDNKETLNPLGSDEDGTLQPNTIYQVITLAPDEVHLGPPQGKELLLQNSNVVSHREFLIFTSNNSAQMFESAMVVHPSNSK